MTKALVLCAGLGTRLQPYTNKRAKPAIEFFGLPMLGYSLYPMIRMGIQQFVVNTHHLPETVKTAAGSLLPSGHFDFSHEEEILGSAGAVAKAKPFYADQQNLFVLNGDTANLFSDFSCIEKMLETHKAEDAFASLLVIPHSEAGNGLSSVWVDENDHVIEFGKTSDAEGARPFHYVGVLLLSKRAVEKCEAKFSSTLTDVILPAIQAGEKIPTHITEDVVFGETGNPTEFLQYQNQLFEYLKTNNVWGKYAREVLQHFRPETQFYGQKEAAIENIPLAPDGFLLKQPSNSLSFGPDAQLQGNNVFCPDSSLETNCCIENVTLLSGVNSSLKEPLSNSIIL